MRTGPSASPRSDREGEAVLAEAPEDILRGGRVAEEIALAQHAAGSLELAGLGFLLDPFGHGAEAEALRQADHGAHDLHAARLGQHAVDEGAVDLQLVDAELVQISEARIAGPEIIDGELDPASFELRDPVPRPGVVVHQHAFRQLQLELPQIDAAIFGNA